ncbi:MAG: NAD(P)-dependent oxidoreductase [Pseudomonadota bacterium]
MAKVAFIGLGNMGYPMAGHLAAAGHQVTVFNRTTAKAQSWLAQHQGQGAATPGAAAADARFVFSCVGGDDDLREITTGENGAFGAMGANSTFIDHSTTSATVAEELGAVARELGLYFIDAPVSGGQVGAEKGVLTVMCGADQRGFDAAKPIIDSYARACTRMGQIGTGQLTKMVNQVCTGGLLQALAEALNFGQRAGLDMDTVLDVISKGAAQSFLMDNRGSTMCEGKYDFGFAVDWMRKDLGIVLDEGQRNGAELPVTALVDSFYAEVQALGGGRWDNSSLIERLRRRTNANQS